MTLRLAFMGTPEFASPTLAELARAGHEIAAVYTQPPRKAGRGMAERPSAVHQIAAGLGLEVRTPVSLKDPAEQARFAALELDAAVVVAYGLILPGAVLDAPASGCFNLHPSLLPRWRGAAPIQRAIMAGDTESGIMVMRMDAGLDTGPVCLGEKVVIGPDVTAGELHDQLARLGAALMVRALGDLEGGALTCQAQGEEGVTYAAKIDKAEARIDFASPSGVVHDLIRGLSPFPGAWFEVPGAKAPIRLKVLRAELADGKGEPGTILADDLTIACGQRAVRLVQVQRAGKAPVSGIEFLRGQRLAPGARVG
ncbi:MAG: methionyl-tRNA formyltransferase [Rhizobiales bacterium]|nr:methionyl-tRNA formyltransferase [Hyphomicrobiales bacterium]